MLEGMFIKEETHFDELFKVHEGYICSSVSVDSSFSARLDEKW